MQKLMEKFESKMAAKKEKKSKMKTKAPKKAGSEGRVAERIIGATKIVEAGAEKLYFLVKVSVKVVGYSCQLTRLCTSSGWEISILNWFLPSKLTWSSLRSE